jgi:hypothetical protein
MVSTLRDPPNSSTEGAKIMRCSYKNSPYFERTRLASSADLKVSEYPLSVNKKNWVITVTRNVIK